MTADAGARRLARLLAASLLALAILPVPQAVAASPAGVGSAAPAPPAARRQPYRVNLARDGDYVRQANFVQCVGASVQMMLNIMEPGADTTRKTQRRLQVQARGMSGPRPDGRIRQGAGVFGWAAALNMNDGGRYGVVGADTLDQAMRIAALAIVQQRRPVGLLVWQGRHAWVMSGFEATGDPRRGDFKVTKAYILDPLHPYGSSAWGPSPAPGTATNVRTVGRQFVPRRIHSQWNLLPGMAALSGKYVLVIPTDDRVSFTKDDPYGLLVSAPVARRRTPAAPAAAPAPAATRPQAPAPSPQLVHPIRLRPS